MISANSLAAFTQEVSRTAGLQPARAPDRAAEAARAAEPPQRILRSAPPAGSAAPAQILPRGSLLDLRV